MSGPELRFQRQIIESVIDLGGYGFKMSNQFSVGIADLALQIPTYPALMVEVKLLDALPRTSDEEIKVALTPRQRQFILAWQAAGGCAGLLVALRDRSKDLILCTRQVHTFPTKKEFLDTCQTRLRGVPLSRMIQGGLLSPLIPTTTPRPSTASTNPVFPPSHQSLS